MSLALLPVLNVELIDRIHDFLPTEPEIEWEPLDSPITIYETKHWRTHSGGPEGGYVYFHKERRRGWYRWRRSWGQEEPTYELITSGVLVYRHVSGEDEKCVILPDDYEIEPDEDTIIMDDDHMRERGLYE